MEDKNLTGYPSIDKPWLKYYTESLADKPLPPIGRVDYRALEKMAEESHT